MVNTCCALNCKNRFKVDSEITFHRFPLGNINLLTKWIQEVGRNFIPARHHVLCSEHFSKDCFLSGYHASRRLKDSAYPTIFKFPQHLRKSELNSQNPTCLTKIKIHDINTGLTRTFDLNVLQVNKSDLQSHSLKLTNDKFETGASKNNEDVKAVGSNSINPSIPHIKICTEKTDPPIRPHEICGTGNNDEIMKQAFTSPSIWTRAETSTLIALLELETCLYHRKDPDFQNDHKRGIAYKRIQQVMACMQSFFTVVQVKKKVKYLLLKYAEEKYRKEDCIRNGLCTEDSYHPQLWYFTQLNFLDGHIFPRLEKPISNKEVKVNETEEEANEELKSEESQQYEKLAGSREESCENQKETSEELNSKESEQDERLTGSREEHFEKNEEEVIEGMSAVSFEKKEEVIEVLDSEDDEQNGMSARSLEKKVERRNKRKENFVCPLSKKVDATNKKSAYRVRDREFIFGRYVANEMKIIKNNPLLYIKTKNTILNILTSANIQAVESNP